MSGISVAVTIITIIIIIIIRISYGSVYGDEYDGLLCKLGLVFTAKVSCVQEVMHG